MDSSANQNPIVPEPDVPKPNAPAPQPADVPPIPKPPLPPSKDDIIAPPEKPKSSFPAKPVVLSLALLLFVSVTALAVYFVQKGGLPFNLEKKAASCDGAYKVCGLNGACGASNDCACFKNFSACEFLDWSCCFTQDPIPPPPQPDKEYDKCSDWGYSDDNGCTADPNCESPSQGGQCCMGGGKFYCCYKDGNCYSGGTTGQCKDNGGGSITLTGPLTSRVFKMTGSNVSCPYSNSNQQTIETVTLSDGQTKTFSLGDECGQIDAVGYCGSCKPGCSTPQNTPTPTRPPNTPTPTDTPDEPVCLSLEAYKSGSNPPSLEGLKVGDTVVIFVQASADVEGIAVRVKRGNSVQTFSSTDGKGSWMSPNRSWIYNYIVPIGGEGTYEISAFVKSRGEWR